MTTNTSRADGAGPAPAAVVAAMVADGARSCALVRRRPAATDGGDAAADRGDRRDLDDGADDHGAAARARDRDRLDPLRSRVRVRQGSGAAGLGRPDRRADRAVGHPLPGHQARPAHRRRCSSTPAAPATPASGSSSAAGPSCRSGATAGSTSSRGIPGARTAARRCTASTSDAEEAAFWKDVAIPYTAEQSAAYPAEDGGPGAAVRRGDGRAAVAHLDGRHRPRPRRLRALSGEEQITYVGFSYGTMLGQTYANMFPERVRAMMLDGVVDAVAVHRQRRGPGGRTTPDRPMPSSTSSPSCAMPPARPTARWPAIPDRPRPSAWTSCSRRSGPAPSRRPTPTRRASSSTATSSSARSPRCATRTCGRRGPSS